MKRLTMALMGLLAMGVLAERPDYNRPNYDKTKIAPYTLEDPLTFVDGTKVVLPADWERRRQEILGIFAKNMYGMEPPKPEAVITEKFDEGITLGGFGIRRQYRMWFKPDKSGPSIDWLVLLPRFPRGTVLPIVFFNYGGNHELLQDPEVSIPEMYLALRKGHRPRADFRGMYEGRHSHAKGISSKEFMFPAHLLLARDYAVVTACYAQVSPDVAEPVKAEDGRIIGPWQGIFDLWPARDPKRDDNISTIGAWAWALSRGLDLVERIPEVDAKKAIAAGYSRLGKTALLAAARDARFAACVPNQTGGGGCPLAKRDYGENVATETTGALRHWYCDAYRKYAKDPAKLLTFDQHLLLAAIAPRRLFVQGYDEPWFDTEGEYLACRAASPVWEFLDRPGLPKQPFPADYSTTCIGESLAYVRRSQGHGYAAHDWMWFMDFCDNLRK